MEAAPYQGTAASDRWGDHSFPGQRRSVVPTAKDRISLPNMKDWRAPVPREPKLTGYLESGRPLAITRHGKALRLFHSRAETQPQD